MGRVSRTDSGVPPANSSSEAASRMSRDDSSSRYRPVRSLACVGASKVKGRPLTKTLVGLPALASATNRLSRSSRPASLGTCTANERPTTSSASAFRLKRQVPGPGPSPLHHSCRIAFRRPRPPAILGPRPRLPRLPQRQFQSAAECRLLFEPLAGIPRVIPTPQEPRGRAVRPAPPWFADARRQRGCPAPVRSARDSNALAVGLDRAGGTCPALAVCQEDAINPLRSTESQTVEGDENEFRSDDQAPRRGEHDPGPDPGHRRGQRPRDQFRRHDEPVQRGCVAVRRATIATDASPARRQATANAGEPGWGYGGPGYGYRWAGLGLRRTRLRIRWPRLWLRWPGLRVWRTRLRLWWSRLRRTRRTGDPIRGGRSSATGPSRRACVREAVRAQLRVAVVGRPIESPQKGRCPVSFVAVAGAHAETWELARNHGVEMVV